MAAPYRDLPQSTALLSKHEPLLTYAGVNGQIDRVGSVLRARKITQSDRVAVVLANGPEMAATLSRRGVLLNLRPAESRVRGGRTGVLLDRPRCQSGRDINRDGTTAAKPCAAVR